MSSPARSRAAVSAQFASFRSRCFPKRSASNGECRECNRSTSQESLKSISPRVVHTRTSTVKCSWWSRAAREATYSTHERERRRRPLPEPVRISGGLSPAPPRRERGSECAQSYVGQNGKHGARFDLHGIAPPSF